MNHEEKRADFFLRVAIVVCRCRDEGISLMPFSFKRILPEQESFVEHGKSETLDSKHLDWLAIDLVVVKDGVLVWGYCFEYEVMREYAVKAGLKILPLGGKLNDIYHLEYAE